MRQEIERSTGITVREAAAEIETSTGTVMQLFMTRAMAQVFLLARVGTLAAAQEKIHGLSRYCIRASSQSREMLIK
jgi:hypothetical protein